MDYGYNLFGCGRVAVGITIPFLVFSERHVAVIPFDKMKLCVREGGGGYSNPCVFWATRRGYTIRQNEIMCARGWRRV